MRIGLWPSFPARSVRWRLGTPATGSSAGLLIVALAFAAGVAVHALAVSAASGPVSVPSAPAVPLPAAVRTAHPAELLRVIDGDTFEARVHPWPGLDVTTRVRLRGIDAPELKARCATEQAAAQAARDALAGLLAQGGIGVSEIGIDKYGGRVLARVSTQATADVSDALLQAGAARRYNGGRRHGWCQ